MPIGHVDYLSAGVPPGRLVATAVRKAWRAARARMAPAPTWPEREELLRGMHCAPEVLARHLWSGQRGLVTCDREGTAAGLASLFPGEAARTVERAVKAASGRLTVFGREISVVRPGGGTDWQLDPLHGGRFMENLPSESLPAAPHADIKVAWAVGRGEQWVALGSGALAEPARAADFAEAFAASLRDFVEQNPLGRGAQWASPMEAALRIVCLGQAHTMLSGEPPLAGLRYALDLAGLTVATARYVLRHLEDAQVVPNNHLAADWVGLLACAALLPEWPEAPRWRALGAAGLAREMVAQTHVEGTTFEGSVPYQRLAIELFTAGALLAGHLGAPLSGAYWGRLAALYAAARALLARTGELPQIGDDDSGRVFTFRPRAALEGSYLLPLGAAILGDPTLRVHAGVSGAEEVLWLFGRRAVEQLRDAPPGPQPASASFPRGGFHVLRRGAMEVAVSCGRNGQGGVGGHSHNDKLAFELRVNGDLVVCDPGSPRYTGDPELRDRFRSTRAHATVVVDGREQAPIPRGRPFALPEAARATCLGFGSSGGRARFVGEHHGYARLGIVHRREIELFDGAMRLRDRLLGTGTHAIEVRFPFPNGDARLRPPGPAERARLHALGAPDGAVPEVAVEYGPAGSPLALVVVLSRAHLAGSIEASAYSAGYAELIPACAAVFQGRLACPVEITTWLLALAGA